MGVGKFDFEPLLPPGRHFLQLDEIRQIAVDPFIGASLSRRNDLFLKAEDLVQQFLVAGIACRIFVDGSFLTQKPIPDDIDLTISVEQEVERNFSSNQKYLVAQVNLQQYIPDVDALVYTSYPIGHPLHGSWSDPNIVCSDYGLEHGGEWAKGYAVLRLHETNVGLRICR